MLTVTIPDFEMYDSLTGEFVTIKGQTISLEHSLVSISKWESKWKKPFIGGEKKTQAEALDYIRCMTITKGVNPLLYNNIPSYVLRQIKDYIDDPMTATTITDHDAANKSKKNQPPKKKITSEEIYWQMTALNIPFECDKWHFNRLQMLLRVCSIKNSPSKKMSKQETAQSNRALNAARRKAAHSKG